VAGGGASPETTRKLSPGLGFACGLDGEVAHDKGIPIGVFRGAGIGGATTRRRAVARGDGEAVRARESKKERGKRPASFLTPQ
jgi:hypothetical protein